VILPTDHRDGRFTDMPAGFFMPQRMSHQLLVLARILLKH
jgi:hypothetical protein